MKLFNAKIIANRPINARYWHMVLDASMLGEHVAPGQFFHLQCGDAQQNPLRRPLSVFHYHQASATLEFLYLVKGSGTQQMAQRRPGDYMNLIGPLGRGFTLPEQGALLLIARGVGVATLHALAREARAQNKAVHVLLSARTANDLLTAGALEEIGAVVHTVTDQEGTSDLQQVRQRLEQLIRDEKIGALYSCGSRRLSKLAQDLAEKYHLKGELAIEAHMACGIGDCYACACTIRSQGQLKTARVCSDGPVFPIEQVVIQ
ncbi:dihydroorotate dehydrogenase electron transfer subunit [Sporolactobacillus terrae]|uniref:dihydroorotate dehydrogenase electron transfer subunit n=1 Tax=Sporolactobacillus terrae TaxID=269673 RepID=UPI001CBCA1A1|nr:dihydroorotate dehydrogenase electron transfer subunit [Sporolactobacillus terrae]